jgi:branched-chain amino acid transport system permease protein
VSATLSIPTAGRVPRGAFLAAALVVLAAAALPFVLSSDSYLLYIATEVALYAIGAMSLHLVFRIGQLSLAHAAFLGVGGYTGALLVTETGLPWPVAYAVAAGTAGLLGLCVGPVVLRLRGVYFVLFSFTFGEFIRLVFVNWVSLTGGSEGISAIPAPVPFDTPIGFYLLVVALALLTAGICARMLCSDFGEAIDSIRASESLARSNGVPVFRIKVMVFAIACALVGVQGALQASFVHYISPITYTFAESLRFVVINVVGGPTTLWGPLVGALFIVSLPELLRQWVDYQWVIYGVVLILVMRYFPGGLAEIGTLAARALRRRP